MGDSNSAWMVLISKAEDASIACLSGRLIRSNSSVPVIAFVKEGVHKCINELYQSFDSVILAPKKSERLASLTIGEADGLLLQLLNMHAMFNCVIAIQPGVLVFQSFQEIMDRRRVFRKTKGDWKIVPFLPNPRKYDRLVKLLHSGVPFNADFIIKELTVYHQGNTKGNEGDTILSWTDLESYTGNTIPFLEVGSDWLKSHLHLKDPNFEATESKLFWQNVVINKLKFALGSSETENFSDSNEKSWIAVVGMSCRFPKANSIEEYWKVLTSGENTSSYPPPNRNEIKSSAKGNFLKCPIEEFDSSFFNIAPAEAAKTDVQARLLLEVSWEAFEDAGINPEKLENTPVGVFHGSWAQDYKDLMNLSERPDQDAIRKYVGNSFGCTAGKLSYFYGFTGPNIATESGCSSSMVAVQLACQHLQSGKCSVALATGANVFLHMDTETKMMWSRDGICKTFDSSADGYGRGEGVAVLVLKRYSDALRDGDRIHGIIRGSASSQEGLSKSFGSPTVENEMRTMINALMAAEVSPNQVDYVEAHATGTGVGDPIEAEALVKAYSSQQERMCPLLIGSVKTNIGHTESCSGIASIIKVLLALKHETIPPHINVKSINAKVDFSPIPGRITLKAEEWRRTATKPRIAGVSNFGLTGTAVHMIIQEPPPSKVKFDPFPLEFKQKHTFYILPLSAKTERALDQLSQAFGTFLGTEMGDGGETLENIIYTASVCRPHHGFRKTVFGQDKKDIVLQLKEQVSPKLESKTELTVGFIFPNIFTKEDIRIEMYAALYSIFPAFKIHMDIYDSLCQKVTNFSPLSYLNPDTQQRLNLSQKFLQLCYFSASYSLYKLWESWGVKSSYILSPNFSTDIGISLGSVLVGKVTFEQAVTMINSSETFEFEYELICCKTGETERCKNIDVAVHTLQYKSCNNFIEVGFKTQFHNGKVSSNSPAFLEVLAVPLKKTNEVESGLETIFCTLADLYTNGYLIDWEGFYRHQPRRKASLPHYPFQRKKIWFKNGESQKVTQLATNQEHHPLLGKFIGANEDNTGDVFTFENCLIAQNQAPYLLDHVFGSEMIFPCAGYLEMAIAAIGSTPIIIHDFHVHRPLHLRKDAGINIKTVVKAETTSESSTWSILLQVKQNEHDQSQTNTWEQVASCQMACFKPGEQQNITEFQIQKDVSEIKKRCIEDMNHPSDFYTKNENLGFIFGPNFQTMKRIYRCSARGEFLVQVSIPKDALNYFCHPLLSDVMIQSYLSLRNPNFTALHLPKSIKKFVCHRRLTPQECSSWESNCFYVYCNEKDDTVYLLDSKGKIVIEMFSLEIIVTTVDTMLTAAGIPKELLLSQGTRHVDTYQVVWKPTTKFQTQDFLKLDTSADFTTLSSYQNLLKSLDKRNRFTNMEELVFKNVNRLCVMYILKAMYEMGWAPEMGRTFELDEIARAFKVTTHLIPAFRQYLGYIVELGVLTEESITAFTIKSLPDKSDVLELSIKELCMQLADYGPIHSINICGSQLAQVLQGKVKGELVLFDEVENAASPMEQIYKTNLYYRSCVNASSQIFFEIACHLCKSSGYKESDDRPRRLRILELGGQTGLFTREALSVLVEENLQYTYYFTTRSSALTKKVEQKFANEGDNLVFKTLDIENDPLQQGFPPFYFDIVVAIDVLHNLNKLHSALENIQRLMKPGGNLIIGETCQPIREMDLTFGIVDDYWKFMANEIRSTHPTISADKWLQLLKQCGFGGPCSKSLVAASQMCVIVATLNQLYQLSEQPELENYTKPQNRWLLLHDLDNKLEIIQDIVKKMSILGRELATQSVLQDGSTNLIRYMYKYETLEGILCVFEGKDEFALENCRSLLEPLLNATKCVVKKGQGRLCLVTFGLAEVTTETPVGCPSSATVLGFLRCVKLELPSLNSKLIDLDPEQTHEKMAELLGQELWMGDEEIEIAYRKAVRYARRLVAAPPPSTELLMSIPHKVENYSIQLPQTNLLSDLTFVGTPLKIIDSDVIVEVKAASLNFKDVLNVMKPSEEFKTMSTIGIDFSGVVSSVAENVTEIAVGTPVFGCSWNHSTFCRYLPISVQDLAVMPENVTFEEAATFPLAFLTAWYCLVNVAQVSAGQTVLIHAASGGVGLIAIQIAKLYDLKIVASAGSKQKRAFLSKLGIPHVYNSRNLEFGKKIQEITNGQGVDVVLNCLTGPGFKETSLEITKVGGYFVEISKLDVWTKQEVFIRKPGVTYKIVDLAIVNRDEIRQMLARLVTLIEEESIKPLPFKRFTASRLIQALKFLQKAKHIGKVVISMPTFDTELGTIRDSIFNERSTYLITGGKGSIGLAIAEWMVSRGAKYLVLMGRGPPNEKALDIAQQLIEKAGAVVIFKEADVANLNECQKVLQDMKNHPELPPLRGIHHCAGVISDRILMNQDWDNFDYVLNPKVKGTYNLHILTETLPLQFFVVHSSIAATFGNFGQSNYSAANVFMEALMAKRRWMGLQGMAVSWGQWNAGLAENMEMELCEPLTLTQGIKALENFQLDNTAAVAAGFLKFDKIFTLIPTYQKTFLEDVALKIPAVCSNNEGRNGNQIKNSLTDTFFKTDGEGEKKIVLNDFVKEKLCETLGFEPNEIGDNVKFGSLGLDSLLGIEFYNKLQSEMGDIRLGYIDMEQQGTIEGISSLIKTLLDSCCCK
ncbi:unnamed protein product [Orchesella dallaii]|uniref:Uncharacterized protein n=1 Tax=Orchesella dallaii TaxID=48710 RepID=A0ABP1RGQ6_9HEXA